VHVWAGRLRGGLAVAVIISCALMAAMVGVIGAEIVTMGVVALPAMLEKKYKKDLALGCICAGGGLATLIPAERRLHHVRPHRRRLDRPALHGRRASRADARRAVHRLHHRPLQAAARARAAASAGGAGDAAREKLALLKELILPGPGRFSVLGSLYMGWATPTEAAGVGVAGAVVAAAWNRRLSWQGVRAAVVDTTKVTAMLYWLFFGSSALIGVYTLAGGTRLIQEAMTNLPVGPMGVILIMMLIWIILGCFIDWIGILLPHRADLRAGREQARLRPGLARRAVLHEHADLVRLAAVRPAAFYLKGVVPPDISLGDIFRSIVPTWRCRSSRSGW
jgi:TRAP-type mannitol/chloroaromatic compound transport system permease large subunit